MGRCKYEEAIKRERKRARKNTTFSKVWVSRLLWLGCIWITLSYVLAFCNKVQIAETLSGTVASVIIAVILGYLCKSYFETKEEEKVKYLRDKNNVYSGSGEDNGI